MSAVLLDSLNAWWPEAILSVGGLLAILAGAWASPRGQAPRGHAATSAITWLTLAAAAAALWHTTVPTATGVFSNLIVCDPFGLAFRWLALGTVAVVALLVSGSRELPGAFRGEALGLLLLIGVGLMLMAEATHLLMAYLAMELVSLTAYVLVGFLDDKRSAEAALKYLLFGALASGIMLYGMSLLFGLTGALSFADIRQALETGPQNVRLLHLPIVLLLAGLAFKISMVPFHLWTPDAYEGAPAAVTAFLSVGPKAAGLALLLRFMEALGPVWPLLAPTICWLTVITMTLGNVVALVQTNVKRLLAYSTIGQVGYLLIGFAVHTSQGIEALTLYLTAYLFMNLGVFACVVVVVNDTGSESLEAFRGLARRAPTLALVTTLLLLSLAGIPPLLGFIGKFLLFRAALNASLGWLAIAGVVNSAIALYYYVNLIRWMYLQEPAHTSPVTTGWPLRVALGVCTAATLGFGLFPGPLLFLLSGRATVNLL